MKSPKFMEIIRTEFPEECYRMLRQETYEWACLIAPLPFYKTAETYLGKPLFSKEEIAALLKRMNEPENLKEEQESGENENRNEQ